MLRGFWRDLPYRTKLVAYSGLVTATALLLAGSVLVVAETASFRKQLLVRVTSAADITSLSSASSLVFNDPAFATRLLESISADQAVDRAGIYTVEGEVFARYFRAGHEEGGGLPAAADLVEQHMTSTHLEITRPVIFGREQVGTVYVRADLGELRERFNFFALGSLAVLAAVMFLSLLLAGFLQRGLRGPIVELQSTADRVGRERDYSLRARLLGRDDLGRLTIAFNAMLEQIQEHEAALEASEARYSHLLGRIDEVVFRMSLPTGGLEFCSPGAGRVFGYSHEDLVRDPDLFPGLVHPDSRAGYAEMIAAAGRGRVTPSIEYRIVTRGGEEKWILQTNYPVYAAGGTLVSLEGFFVEVTQRVVADRERDLLRSELAQAHKLEALGTLAGGIAHDFNNILGAIMGNASLGLDDLPADHPVSEFLETILRASERATDLTRQILAFSRQSRVEQQAVDLGHVLQESLTLLRASLPSTISIKTDVPADLPHALADATQLHQVVMNLCTNAAYAMRDRGGLLEVRARGLAVGAGQMKRAPDLAAGDYLEVVVSDTGEGIPADVQDRIFEPFFTTKDDGDGTGMGLAVVYGIIREHGGDIAVESTGGEGATFRILLPAMAGVAESEPVKGPGPRRGKGRVMVVDDEEMIAHVAQRMLERLGYEVTVFTNPWKALEHYTATPHDYDLVVTDYTMPNLVGLDLARRILDIRPEMPIIITTGDHSRIDEVAVQSLPTIRLATKPFDMEAIAGLVHECLTGDR